MKMLSAKFLVYYKFQRTSKSFKVDENIVWVLDSLDQDETQVTQHLIWIQAVCIWDYVPDWQDKG